MGAREERKVVTVLFTDLVGFTSRAEQLDPEDVRAMLAPYYASLRAHIEQHGGTVEKFIGDAVMAVFGAPTSHEDDALRAVLAALSIRDAVHDTSPELEIRTAVNTGEALVQLDARPDAGEAFVSGDVVNTAARLQSAAPVNGILVGEATYRATRHVIDYAAHEPVEAKGKAQPVTTWEVVAARPRYGTDVEERHTSTLVGRQREVFLLTDAFARCRSEETSQLVTLVGVPGIGKSRLVAELFTMLDNDPDVYWWRQGRSLPYGESRSVWALGEIVKAQAGILETDDADTTARKLAAMVAEVIGEGDDRTWVESHLRGLAGITGEVDETADRRVEAFSAWRRFFEALADERPLVLVFEDLHWADDTLLDFVDHLADWVSGVPMLIVATARPELLDRRPDWGGGKRNATTLSIGALTETETARLLAELLDRAVLDADTQQAVLRRADGNPLYAAEYARMLADRPAGDLPLPETVQGLIAARIDGLPAAEKTLLQDASVLGKVFWPSAVGSPAEDTLHALERKEFVRRDRRSAVAGETQYAFLHLLVRDVAYGQIPRARRMEKHRAAAEWIESLSPDRSEDRAEMLAHHYREALRLAEASGADATPFRTAAFAALAEASERAAALSSWGAATELAVEALALAEEDDPRRASLELRAARGKAWGPAASIDMELAASARDRFLARDDREGATESESLLSWMCWWQGDGDGAREHRERALEAAADLAVSTGKVRAYAQAARLEGIGGDPERAIALADATLAMAEELGRDDLRSSALNSRGIAKADLGDPGAIDDLEAAVELADRSNVPVEMAIARNNLGSVLSAFGRVVESRAVLEEAFRPALRAAAPVSVQWSEMQALIQRMCAVDQQATLEAAAELEKRVVPGSQVENALAFVRGWILASRGETDEGLRLLGEALTHTRLAGERQAIAPNLSATVFALHVAGRDDEANGPLDELLTTPGYARVTHFTWELPLVLVELGRIDEWLAALGESGRASRWHTVVELLAAGELVAAADLYAEMGAPFLEAWARLLAAERGDLSQLEQARAFFTAEGSAPFVRRCAAVLAASA